MSNAYNPESEADLPVMYQIRLKGHLGHHSLEWFEGLSITLERDGNSLLTGPVIDQAALYGILRKVRDLGMQLLSVTRVDSNQPDNPNNSGAL